MKKIIIGNLKMNLLSVKERTAYGNLMKKEFGDKKMTNVEVVICPPFIYLEALSKLSKKIKIGAQDVFSEDSGSYTGEISPLMLKDLGCSYVILGHSERRRYFSENNHEINLKVLAALKNGLKPILCVGEDASQKMEGDAVMLNQLTECLADVSKERIREVVICYEPAWAISSNNPDHLPTANDIMSARLLIQKFLVSKYGAEIVKEASIIYGGSVAVNNVMEVCVASRMDGALIGRESLHPHQFAKIAEIIDSNF